MTVLTRPENGWEWEQGAGIETSHDLKGNVTFHRAPSPQERVYDVVAASSGAVTRGDIARALGLKKTPWLIAVIDGLVADGYLTRSHHVWKNGVLMYRYEVNR